MPQGTRNLNTARRLRRVGAAGAALCLGKVEGLPALERELVRLALSVVRDAGEPGPSGAR